MNGIDLAKELNKVIVNSKEYIQLKEAEMKVFSNIRSENLLKSFIEKQRDFQSIQKELNNDNNINKIRLELMDLYNRVEENADLQLLMESLDNFINYKEDIMKVIDSNINLNPYMYMLKAKKSCNKKCGGCK